MSISRKGSRHIVVDDIEFRWRVRSRPTYDQNIASSPLVLAVEQTGCRGSVLVIELPQAHPSNWMHKPSPGVTPQAVAKYIRDALKAGWKSSVRGPQFRIHMVAPKTVMKSKA
jgi:hypothetical protein